jgi:tRNA nucleotidyltransferase (CCA-adding enzyme)
MNKKFEIPKEIREISAVLVKAGYENFLVGGCVRDLVLGRAPKDWDIATRATPEEIVALFPKTFYENDFGTVGVVNEDVSDSTLRTVEVTPYREEGEYTDYRRPDEVKWAKNIETDLSRRDFTINAIAYDIDKVRFIDPFGGEQDIEKKIIRTVGKPEERFGEDALRMLRALRFASELGFALDHDTQNAIEKSSELMQHVSKERVRDEFVKIVMSENPALALELAARLDLLKYISPEFEKGIGVEQNKAHIFTVWEHLLRSLDHAAKKGMPLHVRLAALFHDIAKPHTKKFINGEATFYGHEVVGARITRKVLDDLKFSKELVEKVSRLVRWHMFFSETETITLSAVRRVVRNVGVDLIWDLMNVRGADRTGMGRPKETTYRLRKYHSMIEEVLRDPISVKQLKVGGEDIMKLIDKPPGPHIGHILEILLAEVLEDPRLNTKEYLEEKVLELNNLKPNELQKLGLEARSKNALEEEKEKEEIRDKYKVK